MPDLPADVSPDGFVRVAAPADVAEGQMTQVDANGTPVLLARVGGRLHACTAHCTHYGAPLATGVLDGTRVVCPWHHAVFDVASGALCEPPALDALKTFDVRESGGDVFVRVPAPAEIVGEGADYAETDGETPEMAAPTDGRLFLVLGAGAAAQACAEALREEGFTGRIALAASEATPPYDRTKLSKGVAAGTAGDASLPLRDAAFYTRHGIDLWTGRTAERLDPDTKTVRFADGETVVYDACLVATGGTPNRLPVPGADLPGVFVLRSLADAHALVAAADGATRAVVVGASFIGMETASSLTDRGIAVTVVDRADTPLAAALGADVGGVFQTAAEAKGASFRLGAGIERIEADDGGGLAVVLASGERLAGDLVVMGVGVRPATAFLDGAPFRRADGGLETDAALRLADSLFAAGDVAAFPDAGSGRRVRIEHWRLAMQHGRATARAMLGHDEPFAGVPFFWTSQFGIGLRYVGHAEKPNETVIDGSLADRTFVAYYAEGDRIVAAAAIGRDRDAAAFHRLLARGLAPTAAEVRAGFDPVAALRAAGDGTTGQGA